MCARVMAGWGRVACGLGEKCARLPVCLLVWCGAGGVVVWAVCICMAVPFAYGGVVEDRMSGWMGRAGHV